MTRRDKCYFVGKRAATLPANRAATAWLLLATKLEAMGEKDVPKFADLIVAIRKSTIEAGDRNQKL